MATPTAARDGAAPRKNRGFSMLSQKDNETLTRVGPGTPMGENLVLFRDTNGRVGLLDERCPHRTASLFYGRNEEAGLRCVYHGLKFDVEGRCVDLPCVPQIADVQKRNLQSQLKAKAYPCVERGDVVW